MNRRSFLKTVAAVPVVAAVSPSQTPAIPSKAMRVSLVRSTGAVIDNAYLSGVYDKIDALRVLEKQVIRGVSAGVKFGDG